MKIKTLVILMFISSTLIGQNVSSYNCFVGQMYLTSDTAPEFTSEGLKEYFLKELPEAFFKEASKLITVQIYIDKNGNPCCKAIFNSDDIDSELLKTAINQMPKWMPAKHNGKEINIQTTIQLEISKGQLSKVTGLAD